MKQIPDNLLPTLETVITQCIANFEQIVKMTDEELLQTIAFMQQNEYAQQMLASSLMEEAVQDIKIKELISGTKFTNEKVLSDLIAINEILQK